MEMSEQLGGRKMIFLSFVRSNFIKEEKKVPTSTRLNPELPPHGSQGVYFDFTGKQNLQIFDLQCLGGKEKRLLLLDWLGT